MPVRRPVCLICLLFLIAVWFCTGTTCPGPSWPVDKLSQRSISLSGRVEDRQYKNGSFYIYLKNVAFREQTYLSKADKTRFPQGSKGILIKMSDDAEGIGHVKIGARLEASGVFVPFERPRNEGMFDARTYYMIRGYEGQLIRSRLISVTKDHALIREKLRCIRDRAFDILRESMDEEDASLMAAMTLGDKTGLESRIKELYQNAGISHVLALSGLHIASVGLAILALLKRLRIPSWAAGLLSFGIIAAYAVMTGMSTSTVRAMIMFGLFVLAGAAGRTYDILSAAAVSAVIILAFNRLYIYDTGFLLSFGAIIGIVFIYPVLVKLPDMAGIKAGGRLLHDKIYAPVCISMSVMLATLPVTGESFMQISLCSVFINLLVIPLMSIVLFTGFLGLITGSTGIKPYVIFKIPHYILALYRALGEASEKIDGNTLVTGKPGRWQTVTYAIIVITVVFSHNNVRNGFIKNNGTHKCVDRHSRHFEINNKRNSIFSANKITYITENGRDQKKMRRKNLAKAIITIVMLLLAIAVFIIHPRRDLEIRNIDVGQGDCALISGEDLPVIMIDGGSSDIKQVGKYRVVPVLRSNRVTVIDHCFLTHMDSDHVNAVIEMLEDENCPVRISNIIVSDSLLASFREKDHDKEGRGKGGENLGRLIRCAKMRKIKVSGMSAGDILKTGKVRITCLSPGYKGVSAAGRSPASTDENDNSLVLSMEYSDPKTGEVFRALFTGDISENTEKVIGNVITDCDYLKVAHHGSRYSSSKGFLGRALPELSVISAGVDNSYRHPHPETIERLNEIRSRILCTADCGEIIVSADDGKIMVRTLIQQDMTGD